MSRLFISLAIITGLLFPPAVAWGNENIALAVGDEKVSADEIFYLMGVELGGSDALGAVTIRAMSRDEQAAFLERVSMAMLFSRGAILKGLQLDPKIAAQLRWNQINLLANAYIASLAPRLAFSEKDLRAYYGKNAPKYITTDKVKIRQMNLASDEEGRSALLALLSGEDFFSVAGRMGREGDSEARWVEEGALPEPLDKLLSGSSPGDFLGPLKIQGCLQIVEFLERKAGRRLIFDEAREMVRADMEKDVLDGEVISLTKRFPATLRPEALGLLPLP